MILSVGESSIDNIIIMTLVENVASNNRVESGDVDQSKSSISISSFHQQKKMIPNGNGNGNTGLNHHHHHHHHQMKVNGVDHHDHEEEGFKKEMRDLAEMLSKLNPMAEEFVPPSLTNNNYTGALILPPSGATAAHFGYSVVNDFLLQTNQTPFPNINGVSTRRVCLFSFVFSSSLFIDDNFQNEHLF